MDDVWFRDTGPDTGTHFWQKLLANVLRDPALKSESRLPNIPQLVLFHTTKWSIQWRKCFMTPNGSSRSSREGFSGLQRRGQILVQSRTAQHSGNPTTHQKWAADFARGFWLGAHSFSAQWRDGWNWALLPHTGLKQRWIYSLKKTQFCFRRLVLWWVKHHKRRCISALLVGGNKMVLYTLLTVHSPQTAACG